MVNQPQTDAPFGLQPSVAAGLAYLLGLLGGIVMLVGGGTNRAVKWAAAQSITFWGGFLILRIALGFIMAMMGFTMLALFGLISLALTIIAVVVWIWTSVTAFQGKEVEIPVVAGLTRSLFASQLGGA
ncbi:MAG: hypothetical protein ACLQPV_07390 [Vulcanimicrobiaceae bacterium]